MEINGKNISFAYTMRAYRDIADICEGGDIRKLIPAITGKHGNSIENTCKFVVALINAAAHRDGTDTMTADELLDLDAEVFSAMSDAAIETFTTAQKRNVQATAKKKQAPGNK